ncbi:hypothetical protein TRVL_08429 [Trypanosoma vivax]|uniref:Uncharacterized protein n=1 Tax=Trypanosoma vivax (strain Y486) TaxID=1055687 RepID=G0U7N6_TRYVY|nr:hypothetical protein TRVL_08429 [Trypanosoma vivax]CCC51894.1 hypothetical protein TVY486_1009390 [Trypanosoma vivax Y486]
MPFRGSAGVSVSIGFAEAPFQSNNMRFWGLGFWCSLLPFVRSVPIGPSVVNQKVKRRDRNAHHVRNKFGSFLRALCSLPRAFFRRTGGGFFHVGALWPRVLFAHLAFVPPKYWSYFV